MPTPFTDAQNQSATSGFGYQPAPPSADMSGAQAPPAGSMAPPAPSPALFQGSATEMGQIRDSIMAQFPGINNLGEEEGFTPAQKFGLIAIALANPQGALDMVRQKQERLLKQRQMAAEFNMHALTLSGHVMDAQHQMALGIAQLNQRAAEAKMENDRGIASNETQRGMMRVQQTRADLERMQSDREAQGQDMARSMMTEGTDESGQDVSSPPGTPGFKSRADNAGLGATIGSKGIELAPNKRSAGLNNSELKQRVATELSARAKGMPKGTGAPEFAGVEDGVLNSMLRPPSIMEGIMGGGGGGGGGAPSMDPTASRPY